MSDVSELIEAYHVIGAQICEELGHEWEELPQPEGAMNSGSVEKCQRCDERRSNFINQSTTSHSGFYWSGGGIGLNE